MRTRTMRATTGCLALGLAACGLACSDDDDRPRPRIPVFVEREPNDSEFTADDFGVLRAGDHFIIRGNINDVPFDPFDPFNGHDPFDGFAFTAGEPIHVEVLLDADRPGVDLDVCLYDPALGLELACFATANDPELGAVDVLAGGFSFHLVVESFVGSSDYSLELRVFRLQPASVAPDTGLRAGAPAVVAAVHPDAAAPADHAAGAARGAFPPAPRPEGPRLAGYARPRPAEPRPVERLRVFAIDPETGTVTSSSIVRFSDGTSMGIPDGTDE